MIIIKLSYKEASILINIAISTIKLKSLKTPYATIRPSLHVVMCGNVGSMKSTILKQICDKLKTTYTLNLTSPNIVGSVDKTTGQPVLPSIWDSRNSILGIDDFYTHSKDYNRNALMNLLTVMEFPEFIKRMGYRCNDYTKRDKGLYIIVKDNQIKIKTKFNLFMNTMINMDRPQRMIELEALKTRCMVIPYYPDVEEIGRIARGEPVFFYKKIEPKNKHCVIDNKTYEDILNYIERHKHITAQNYMRTLGDLCRITAIVGYNEEIFELLMRVKIDYMRT